MLNGKNLETKIEQALSASLWKPVDRDLYRMFEESTAEKDRAAVRRGVRGAVACFISFGLYDIWLFPDVGLLSFCTRAAVGLLFLAIVEMLALQGKSLRAINVTCAVGLSVASLAWLAVASQTAEQAHFGHFMVFGTIFVISSCLFFRFGFIVSTICSTTITVLFSVAATHAALDVGTKLIIVSYFFGFLGFTLYLSWHLTAERYFTFLNATRARLSEAAVREKGRQLAQIANTDHLTGLRNRRAVVQDYTAHRDRWLRSAKPIAVILIDVDYFKAYNDHYGHQSGDRCLVEVGRALESAATASGGILGRYGGEEFIAFCHVQDEDGIRAFADRMRSVVENLAIPHVRRADRRGIVTVSIGATMTRASANPELDRMSSEADKALYSAKSKGRNRIAIFDPEAPITGEEENIIAAFLGNAVSDGLVSLVYQPIVDIREKSVYSVETLMRLKSPDGSSVSPTVFIPVAERTGIIVELGLWAIEQACRDILVPRIAQRVSVNVSAVQLRAPGFPLFVAKILAQFGLAPSSLALELTEGVDITSDSRILQAVMALQQIGVQIWLDDFGTGYAGLAWLDMIDFDVVKIDKRFLHGSDTPAGAQFMKDILMLLRNHGSAIVVEGVETEEHAAFLSENGTFVAQGYLFCKPTEAANLAKTEIFPSLIQPSRRLRVMNG